MYNANTVYKRDNIPDESRDQRIITILSRVNFTVSGFQCGSQIKAQTEPGTMGMGHQILNKKRK
jgi:hypothetical protein